MAVPWIVGPVEVEKLAVFHRTSANPRAWCDVIIIIIIIIIIIVIIIIVMKYLLSANL